MTHQTTSQHRWRRALRWAALAGVPLLAAAIAWVTTRDRPEESAEDTPLPGTPASSASAQPVALTADQAQRIGVTYAVASIATLAREIRTVGQVTWDETRLTTVSLKVDGWVEQLQVNFTGQEVAAGTPLLTIYSPMLVTVQEELLLARRLEADVASGSAETRANAGSLLAAARRRLAYWDVPPEDVAGIETEGRVRRTLTLRAPVDGFVVEKNVFQGQRVMAGDALYRIADLRGVWVEGEVFERDLPSIRLGQQVTAELDALPGRTLTGRIAYLYPTLNPETRTTRVRVELPNPAYRLKPGMYATLVWRGAGAVAALSVPRTAVVSTGQRNLLFVKRPDGMLEPRLVDIGIATDDRVQILRGLRVGETVVKSATFLVDAESNLSTLLGGMGNMPGMDMTAPKKPDDTMRGMDMTVPKKPEKPDAHTNH